ncbi:hypothetical protein AC067_12940 [Escherichia coli]|nr:hypothetical protein AC067_12940 [Escherichia coli]
MTNATLPDALRLSGLQGFCNILNLQYFVGRIRRSRRIRQSRTTAAGWKPCWTCCWTVSAW